MMDRTAGRRTRLLVPTTMTLALLFGTAGFPQELAVGKPFPSLALPSLSDGRPTSVQRFSGQKLILHIWASW